MDNSSFSVFHEVPSPCGHGDEACHAFPSQSVKPLRYVLVRFHGIHDSHYIGINRLRLHGEEGELSYTVLAADGAGANAAGAMCVATAGGWWAKAGESHSLLLELEDEDRVKEVGMWCANRGATPKMMEICDGRKEEPELCAQRDQVHPASSVRDISHAAAPCLHKVPNPCGSGDNKCHAFPVRTEEPLSYLAMSFSGIHDSHYIGVNRLRVYKAGGAELDYKVLAADGSASGLGGCCVGRDGGWWAPCGGQHSLLLKLEEEACIESIGLWCANRGATPQEIRVSVDLSWIPMLVSILLELAKDPSLRLGRRARRLMKDSSSILIGLAANDRTVRDAILAPVFEGAPLEFPIRKDDALGRLRAQMLCDASLAAESDFRGNFKTHRISGVEWQDFSWPSEDLPTLEDFNVCVRSVLVEACDTHGDEWLGTQLYVPPGGVVRLRPASCGGGWRAKVGAHTDDISCRDNWPRWPRVSIDVPLVQGETSSIFTPFGGLLYLVRTCRAEKSASVSCSGNLVQQPLVSVAEGIDVAAVHSSCGGWVDCEGKNVVLTVPVQSVREAISSGADVIAALEFYDSLWAHYNDLSPRTDARKQRIVPDVEISGGWMHSGYPVMTHYGEVIQTSKEHPIPRVFDVARIKREGNWGLFHELGHNMQRSSWTFNGTVEVTVNLFTLYGFQKLCDPETTEEQFKKHTQIPEDFHHSGCPRQKWNAEPFLALRTYAQVLKTFGWEPLMSTFKSYAEEGQVARDYEKQVRDFVKQWSLEIGRDIRPHWRKWGFAKEVDGHDEELLALTPWSYE